MLRPGRIPALILAGLISGAAMTTSAAAAVTVDDNYIGAGNPWGPWDVIGDPAVFDIQSATFSRTGPGADTLHVVVNTNFAGLAGTPQAYGMGYGALFITPGANAWQPTGPAPYLNDVYKPGEWTYAFVLPEVPSTSSGTAGLYAVSDGDIQFGLERTQEAVQLSLNQGAIPIALGTWAVSAGQITMDIVDNGSLGDAFAFSWGMTCGNDIIQGQVSGVPEPAGWSLMCLGLGGLGAALRLARRRRTFAVEGAAA